MLVRKTHLSDFSGIYKLLVQLRPANTYDFEELNFVFLKGLKTSTQFYFTALDDDKVVGFCSLSVKHSLWENGYLGHVDELVVDKDSRRQGIGRMLMETAIKLAEENNCKRLELDSALESLETNAFHERLGFESRGDVFIKSIITPEAV